ARAISERLRAATNLVAAVTWEPPWLEHPGEMGELLAYLWLNQSPAAFAELARSLEPGALETALTNARQELATSLSPGEIGRLSYDPFGLTRLPDTATGSVPSFSQGQELFSSPDGTFRILFVNAAVDLQTYRECDHWVHTIREIAEQS